MGMLILFWIVRQDEKGIAHALEGANQPSAAIEHIEYINDREAIAFYRWGEESISYIGYAFVEQGTWGWTLISSAIGEVPMNEEMGLMFADLRDRSSIYTDLITGELNNSEVVEVKVSTLSGKSYEAFVVGNESVNRYWFLFTNEDDLIGATITGLSVEGEVLLQKGL